MSGKQRKIIPVSSFVRQQTGVRTGLLLRMQQPVRRRGVAAVCQRKGWMKMKERFMRFMQGRYGVDPFSKFLLVSGLVVVFLSAALGNRTVGAVFYLLGWILIIYCYFRMFSRNVSKRYAENQTFLAKTYKVREFFRKQKNIWKQRRVYHIYTCPNCRQKIRIPRGKGKIEIRCPKCGTIFIKKS